MSELTSGAVVIVDGLGGTVGDPVDDDVGAAPDTAVAVLPPGHPTPGTATS